MGNKCLNDTIQWYALGHTTKIAMPKSIRILLTIAVYYDYEIWQMNVKTAFLNEYIEENIFIEQFKGFESKDGSKVCKFKWSIYGLKQA